MTSLTTTATSPAVTGRAPARTDQPIRLDPRLILTPIDAASAARLRAQGGPVSVADAHPGYPCRQCLQDAEPGERLVLVAYDPFSGTSPYRAPSPVFLHVDECRPPEPGAPLPEQLTRRRLSVRAFDRHEIMTAARLIDGIDLAEVALELLDDPGVQRLDVHNAARGCWAVSIHRATCALPLR